MILGAVSVSRFGDNVGPQTETSEGHAEEAIGTENESAEAIARTEPEDAAEDFREAAISQDHCDVHSAHWVHFGQTQTQQHHCESEAKQAQRRGIGKLLPGTRVDH